MKFLILGLGQWAPPPSLKQTPQNTYVVSMALKLVIICVVVDVVVVISVVCTKEIRKVECTLLPNIKSQTELQVRPMMVAMAMAMA